MARKHPNPNKKPTHSFGEEEKDHESSSSDEKQEDYSKTKPQNTPVPQKL
ncbi:hypothetical protein CCACVL1_07894 [Corchorus capsularis]|uniref:Uncharacterized protein n=1 Tax=Corchorus capsularis TaxID=210143 RepID=A0A1R3J3K5_COCAP|nr:hypothetical protein CCACVL1_07894 [Corchorus capsularis]